MRRFVNLLSSARPLLVLLIVGVLALTTRFWLEPVAHMWANHESTVLNQAFPSTPSPSTRSSPAKSHRPHHQHRR